MNQEQLSEFISTARYSKTPEYKAWINMRSRCKDQAHSKPHYFDRGIKVCSEWDRSFPAFLSHVGLRPSAMHSIDRIDGDGDYEPGNVRWATPDVQGINQHLRSTNTTGYRGVWSRRGYYEACITSNNVFIHLGRSETAEEAALCYDAAAIQLHGEFARTNLI